MKLYTLYEIAPDCTKQLVCSFDTFIDAARYASNLIQSGEVSSGHVYQIYDIMQEQTIFEHTVEKI